MSELDFPKTDLLPATKAQPLATASPFASHVIEDAVADAIRAGHTQLKDIMDALERMQQHRAEAEFNGAFAEFQSACPKVPRNRTAKIITKGGTSFGYDYADVESIMSTVRPILAEHLLSVAFGDSTFDGQRITETCIVSHVAGHSRKASFTTTLDTDAGMSPQQKYGNASTYAQRRALSKALGIWTGDPDDDGNEPDTKPTEPRITEEHVRSIQDLLIQTNRDKAKLLKHYGVASIADLTEAQYADASAMMTKVKT